MRVGVSDRAVGRVALTCHQHKACVCTVYHNNMFIQMAEMKT